MPYYKHHKGLTYFYKMRQGIIPKLSKRYAAPLALLLAAVLIISREPDLLSQPRFWWDEGAIAFKYAFEHDWLNTLLSPHQGYYSFINNIAALRAATLVPLELAPFVTTYLSFLVQLLPHCLIWLGRSPYWDTIPRKLLASLLILYVSADCTVWLNIVDSQFHLSLITFLILMEQWENRSRVCKVFYTFLLAVAGLSGVVSCFLTPLFIYRAWKEKNREAILFSGVLIVASLLQLGIVIWWFFHGIMYDNVQRFTNLNSVRLIKLFTGHTIGKIFLGVGNIDRINLGPLKGLTYGIWGYAVIFFYLPRTMSWDTRIYFLGAFLLIAILSLVTSLNTSGGARYFYTPNVILMLMALQSISRPRTYSDYIMIIIAGSLLMFALARGIDNYYNHFPCYNAAWPKWESEVRRWNANPNYRLKTHPPKPRWIFHLRVNQ